MKKKIKINENILGWLIMAPILIMISTFVLFPAIQNIALSFFSWDGYTEWKFNGIQNYVKVFTKEPLFYKSLINTVIFQIGATTGTVIVGFIFAVIIDLKVKLWRTYRIIFFLPYVLAQFAVATLWRTVFTQDGVLNAILEKLNLGSLQVIWFETPWVAKAVMIFVAIWQYSSFPMIFFLAGMQTIEPEIYEAAEIDGATRFQRIIKITLPLLKNVLSIVVIFQIILSFKVFTYVYVMTEGRPAGQTHVLGTLLYRYAFNLSQFGYSSVLAIVMLVMALIFAFIYLRISGYREILKKK